MFTMITYGAFAICILVSNVVDCLAQYYQKLMSK